MENFAGNASGLYTGAALLFTIKFNRLGHFPCQFNAFYLFRIHGEEFFFLFTDASKYILLGYKNNNNYDIIRLLDIKMNDSKETKNFILMITKQNYTNIII